MQPSGSGVQPSYSPPPKCVFRVQAGHNSPIGYRPGIGGGLLGTAGDGVFKKRWRRSKKSVSLVHSWGPIQTAFVTRKRTVLALALAEHLCRLTMHLQLVLTGRSHDRPIICRISQVSRCGFPFWRDLSLTSITLPHTVWQSPSERFRAHAGGFGGADGASMSPGII